MKFEAYPDILEFKHIKEILGYGHVKTVEIVNKPNFPRLKIGRKVQVPKDVFIEWLKNNAVS